jgi:hypothetical protein
MGIKCYTHVNIKHTGMESVHCSLCESGCSQIITVFQHMSMLFLRLNVPDGHVYAVKLGGKNCCVACQLFTSKLGAEFVFQKFMGENFYM